jgi:hypothetical protein
VNSERPQEIKSSMQICIVFQFPATKQNAEYKIKINGTENRNHLRTNLMACMKTLHQNDKALLR